MRSVESALVAFVIRSATPEPVPSLSPLATSAAGGLLEQTALQQDVLALFDRFRDLCFATSAPLERVDRR
jgi:hypothetical protein